MGAVAPNLLEPVDPGDETMLLLVGGRGFLGKST